MFTPDVLRNYPWREIVPIVNVLSCPHDGGYFGMFTKLFAMK